MKKESLRRGFNKNFLRITILIILSVIVFTIAGVSYSWIKDGYERPGVEIKTGKINATFLGYKYQDSVVEKIYEYQSETGKANLNNGFSTQIDNISYGNDAHLYYVIKKNEGSISLESKIAFYINGLKVDADVSTEYTDYVGGFKYAIEIVNLDNINKNSTDVDYCNAISNYANGTFNVSYDKLININDSQFVSTSLTDNDYLCYHLIVSQMRDNILYTNEKINIVTDITVSQVGGLTGGLKIYYASNETELKEYMSIYSPGSTIQITKNITTSNFTINRPLTLQLIGNLQVNGNFLIDYEYEIGDFEIDTTFGGKINVSKFGSGGGKFTINLPKNGIVLKGRGSATVEDVCIENDFTITTSYDKPADFDKFYIKNNSGQFVDIYVGNNSKLIFERDSQAGQIIPATSIVDRVYIENKGIIEYINLAKMVVGNSQPQIVIDNFGIITRGISLPKWAVKYVDDATGNTRVICEQGASTPQIIIDVSAPEGHFKSDGSRDPLTDDIEYRKIEEYVIDVSPKQDYTMLEVTYTNDLSLWPDDVIKPSNPVLKLEYVLKNFLNKNDLNVSDLTYVTYLKVITLSDMVLHSYDFEYIRTNMKNLVEIDMSMCHVENNTMPSNTFSTSSDSSSLTKLERVELPKGIISLPGYCFNRCLNMRFITIPETVKSFGSSCFPNSSSNKENRIVNMYVEWNEYNSSISSIVGQTYYYAIFKNELVYDAAVKNRSSDASHMFKNCEIVEGKNGYFYVSTNASDNTCSLLGYRDYLTQARTYSENVVLDIEEKENDTYKIDFTNVNVNGVDYKVTEIGPYAFVSQLSYSSDTREVHYEIYSYSDTLSIGDSAFNLNTRNDARSKLYNVHGFVTKVHLEGSGTIANCVFSYNKLTECYLPNITSIGTYAFLGYVDLDRAGLNNLTDLFSSSYTVKDSSIYQYYDYLWDGLTYIYAPKLTVLSDQAFNGHKGIRVIETSPLTIFGLTNSDSRVGYNKTLGFGENILWIIHTEGYSTFTPVNKSSLAIRTIAIDSKFISKYKTTSMYVPYTSSSNSYPYGSSSSYTENYFYAPNFIETNSYDMSELIYEKVNDSSIISTPDLGFDYIYALNKDNNTAILLGCVAEEIRCNDFYVPSKIEHDGETYYIDKIADDAFRYTKMNISNKLVINDDEGNIGKLEKIGRFAFYYTCPNALSSTTRFRNYSFEKNINTVEIKGEGLITLGAQLFHYANIEHLIIGCPFIVDSTDCNSYTTNYLCAYSNVKDVLIKYDTTTEVTDLGDCAFYCCYNLTDVKFEIQSSTIKLNNSVFSECNKLESFICSEGSEDYTSTLNVTGSSVLYNCTSLEEFKVDNFISSSYGFFNGAKFEVLEFNSLQVSSAPSKREEIDTKVFISNCENLKSIIIKGDATINETFINNCNNIESIIIKGNLYTNTKSPYIRFNNSLKRFIVEGSFTYTTLCDLDSTSPYPLYDLRQLEEVSFGEGSNIYKLIGKCPKVKELIIPNNCRIGYDSSPSSSNFVEQCSALEYVEFKDNCTFNYHGNSFYRCDALKKFVAGDKFNMKAQSNSTNYLGFLQYCAALDYIFIGDDCQMYYSSISDKNLVFPAFNYKILKGIYFGEINNNLTSGNYNINGKIQKYTTFEKALLNAFYAADEMHIDYDYDINIYVKESNLDSIYSQTFQGWLGNNASGQRVRTTVSKDVIFKTYNDLIKTDKGRYYLDFDDNKNEFSVVSYEMPVGTEVELDSSITFDSNGNSPSSSDFDSSSLGTSYPITGMKIDALSSLKYKNITKLIIPASYKDCYVKAGDMPTSLEEFEVYSSAYKVEDGVLYSSDYTYLLCYPASKVGTEYTIDSRTQFIANDAFSNCIYLENIYVPKICSTTGEYELLGVGDSFKNCTKLKYIIFFGDAVSFTSSHNFEGCNEDLVILVDESKYDSFVNIYFNDLSLKKKIKKFSIVDALIDTNNELSLCIQPDIEGSDTINIDIEQ